MKRYRVRVKNAFVNREEEVLACDTSTLDSIHRQEIRKIGLHNLLYCTVEQLSLSGSVIACKMWSWR